MTGFLILAARQLMGTGDQGDQDHHQADDAVGERFAQQIHHQIAKQKHATKQKPEQGGAIPFGVVPVPQGHADQQHDHHTDQIVNFLDVDERAHAAAPDDGAAAASCCIRQAAMSRCMLASSRVRRNRWTISAESAVGIAHKPICNGSI